MYEKLEVCPVCKHTNFSNYLICTDHSITGESFALTKCQKCQLVFTNPRPTDEALPKYYESEDYISHTDRPNNLINFIYRLVRGYTTRKKIQLIKKHSSGATLLDFGCGTGDFVRSCQQSGFETSGYEPNASARAIANKKGVATIEDLSATKERFDIITAWHVIEHVSELRKTIKLLKKKLTKQGILIVAVPNLNSLDAQHYQEYWAALDVPRHLYHFTKETFGRLIAASKMNIVDVHPMYFDSYYVSMLSEKYQSHKRNLFKALKVGFQSNRAASKTGEYSSLIYLIKK